MAVLAPDEAAVLAAAGDRIFPADESSPAASDLGLLAFAERQLGGPWGRGERMYLRPPFATPDHPGHGWQAAATPAEAVAATLRGLLAGGFLDLDDAGRDAALARLERDEPAAFALLRALVIESVLAHPSHGGNRAGAGWRWLGFPGDPVELGQPYAGRLRR
ncbi:MAG TPA: gluconate 2-dehydrogenase subunit 3 family protein [Candidatus Dormibacteraeota bacterium]